MSTQTVPLTHPKDMRPGDVFVELDYSDNPHGPLIVVEREVPDPPRPGTLGEATVLGEGRAQGFINEDGGFSFWDGEAAQEVHVDDIYDFVPMVLRPEITREQVLEVFRDNGMDRATGMIDRVMDLLEGKTK